MKKTLRVLHVEDSEQDVALLTRHLNKAGYDSHSLRVDSDEEMRRALSAREWDVILCDYSMPNFSALSALALLKELNLDIPFIIISGTVGEAFAVEAMRAGANDYLIKDNLARLVPIIEREMRDAENRHACREAEDQVRLHATALEAAANAIVITDNQGKVTWVNPAFTGLTGYELEEVLGKSLRILKSGEHDQQFYKELWDTVLSGKVWHGELINRRKDGSLYFEEQTITPVKNGAGEITNFIAIKQDITEQKRSDEERSRLTAQLESERQRLNDIISNVPGIVWETWVEPDPASHRTNFITNYVETMLGYSAEEWLSKPNGWLSVIHPDDRERALKKAEADWEAGRDGIDEFRWITRDGSVVWVEARKAIVRDEKGAPIGRRGVTLDITERKQAEEALRESEDRYRDLIEHSHDLICTHDLTGQILSVNQMMGKVLGYDQETLLKKNIRDLLFHEFRDEFDSYIEELKEKGIATGLMSVETSSGERRIWEYTNTLRTEGVAEPVVRGVGHDITERMGAEHALRRSESELRTLFAAMTDVILEFDSEGRYLMVAPTNPSLLYKPSEELLGKRVDEVFPKEQADFFLKHIRQTLNEGRMHRVEYMLEIGGTEIWFDGSVSPMSKNSVVWIGRDITERKQAEAELRFRQSLLESQTEASIDGILVVSKERLILSYNKRFRELWNIPEEILGMRGDKLAVDYVLDKVAEPQEFLEEIEYLYQHPEEESRDEVPLKDGRTFDRYSAPVKSDDGEYYGRVWFFRDITGRKLAETERRVLYEITQGAITTRNLDDLLKLVHSSICQILNAENCFIALHDEATDLLNFEFWIDKFDPPPEPVSTSIGFTGFVLRTGRPLLLTDEFKEKMYREGIVRRAGRSSASWLGVPLRTHSHTIGVLVVQRYDEENVYTQRDLQFLSSVGDQVAMVIERKRAEDALRESEERYRDLVENAHDIIYSHDLEGNYTSVNKAGEKITGYTREEALKMNIAQIVAPEDLEKVREMLSRKLAGEDTTAYELEIIAKDGRRIALEVNTKFVIENGVPVGVQGIARDVTERKTLEEQFRQSQKMEAIGQLAGGVAHDFNNLITVITGYSELAMRRLNPEDPLYHSIEEIKKAGDRAAALTRQLLAFSRKQVLQPVSLNLNSVISDLEKMLRRLIGEDIELKTELDEGLGSIKADPGQIEQIILNLAVNARDAMPAGGKLTIETENVLLDKRYAGEHIGVSPGQYVMLAVSDTGMGMNEKTKARIFEPFFTTKELGKGTGLGLSTVYGIVKQSGGNIWVYSEVGRGTTFKIYLPCAEEGADEYRRGVEIEGGLKGTETILLAEDEDVVRKLAIEVLEEYGYRVLDSANGGGALLICEREKSPIHLLITDVIMPEMNGRELSERLKKLRPEMKVLFMSGYTDNAISHQGVLNEGANFIEKPFSPRSLAKKVRDVLDEGK